MEHELKTWPYYYNLILAGAKTFELRKDDRNPRFAIGDFLKLREFDEKLEVYTGREMRVQVSHIIRQNTKFDALKKGWCIMSIKMIGG